jgi:hypothetical protein
LGGKRSKELEQVFVRGINRRGLRLDLVAALGIALAFPVLQTAAANAQQQVSTSTTLTVASQGQAYVAVTGADGAPASGVVSIEEGNHLWAQAALNSAGQANAALSLSSGNHVLRAAYLGDATHEASISEATPYGTTGTTTVTPTFTVSAAAVAPATLPLTLTQGQAGTLSVTVTPVNNSALASPMFVTLSCSGLPQEASCTFTPASVEILPTTPTSCTGGSTASACPPTSSMLIQTQAQKVTTAAKNRMPASGKRSSPIAWAFLLPGALGLSGLAWGARRRRWLQRLALVALVGVVTTLGATGCNPNYYYFNHGPEDPPATPTGSYTVIVTAQSSNGVTAIQNSTSVALTVN